MKSSIYLLNWTVPLVDDLPEYLDDLTEEHLEPGVFDALSQLSAQDQLYVVAGSTELSDSVLQRMFEQLHLARYFQGYFCAANVQLQKGTPAFLLRTLMMLNSAPGRVTVIGEDYQQDILPALLLGLKAVWLNKSESESPDPKVKKIGSLSELTQHSEAIAQ